MNIERCKYIRLVVFLLCTAILNVAAGDPNNGSFELFDYNDLYGRNDPNGWHTENYVTVSSGFVPDEFHGSKESWRIDTASVFPAFKGDNLLVLSSGDSSVQYGRAWQQVSIQEGDKLTGVYFFGACDYEPFNDWAEIKLVPINSPNLSEIIVAYADIGLLGENYGSFQGWERFEYTFGAEEVGDYDLVLLVSDYSDYQLDSYMLVDGIVLCRNNSENPPPDKGDLNCDCTVNIEDFTLLARDWQYDCNTPTYDPNCNCLLGSDIDGSGPVDFNDMRIMLENWLAGIKEEE